MIDAVLSQSIKAPSKSTKAQVQVSRQMNPEAAIEKIKAQLHEKQRELENLREGKIQTRKNQQKRATSVQGCSSHHKCNAHAPNKVQKKGRILSEKEVVQVILRKIDYKNRFLVIL